MQDVVERFWSKVDRSGGPDACWPWTAHRGSDGYGKTWTGHCKIMAHRFALELTDGPATFEGAEAMHACDNRPCCNPAHLRWGTRRENAADMVAKGRQAHGDRHVSRTKPERLARGERHGSRTKPESRPRGDRHHSRTKPECIARGDSHGSRTMPERVPRGERHGSRTKPERTARGERHGNAKLTEADVEAIRFSTGTTREVGGLFGISATQVSNIRNGKSWRDTGRS